MNLRLKIAGAVSTIAMLATTTSVIAQEIRVWTTETQPARLERQQEMAANYEAATGVKVEMIPVEETDYSTRATAAFAAGDLPEYDIMLWQDYEHEESTMKFTDLLSLLCGESLGLRPVSYTHLTLPTKRIV
mgnify:CR=1 FL=1